MKPVNLEELEALEAKATRATRPKWFHSPDALWGCVTTMADGLGTPILTIEDELGLSEEETNAVAEFIVALRNNAPAMFAELRELRAERDALRAEVERLGNECERERMRLSGCGVVASANTAESVKQRLTPGHPYWSASYGDVCAAVDREMTLRAQLATATRIEADIHGDLSAFDARLVANTGSHVEFKNARATVRGTVEILLSELENKNTQLATAHDDAVEECASLAESIPAKQRHSGREFAFELRALKGKTKTNGGGA